MPWDSVDKYRDEDETERRKRSRRKYNHLSGRRKIDLKGRRWHPHWSGPNPHSSVEEQLSPKE